ncbi:hypothetical protein [Leucobacter aridicollis]|uniref:Uncharacterized protein n=1 Tax=Leucobacter aridicollis TaxID=283878 RepID=A0A852R970_9MICO|nr:hypothetical protein [Leucobacter aridicollis]MBL3681994.1 hypothetical protein [Leucobacter aridicollis]NYD26959.1 hypothetical protein [Leucobacter aridicollis]
MTEGERTQPLGITDDEQGWVSRINETAKTVRMWRDWAKSAQRAQVGSDLDLDRLVGLDVESAAWNSIASSIEHLGFFADVIHATGAMYPTAYMTVARTAFMGAVNAHYLLAPEKRTKRQERALNMRAQELKDQVNKIKELSRMPAGVTLNTQGALDHATKQIELLRGPAQTLGKADPVYLSFNQTNAVTAVATYMRKLSNSDTLELALASIWRDGSAAAHAQQQYLFSRSKQGTVIASDPRGTVVSMRGELGADAGPAFLGSFAVLNDALRLYNLRRLKH